MGAYCTILKIGTLRNRIGNLSGLLCEAWNVWCVKTRRASCYLCATKVVLVGMYLGYLLLLQDLLSLRWSILAWSHKAPSA